MGFKLELITHKDITPSTKKWWVETGGRRYFYLKNGFKSSASNVLLPIGVLGLWEWWTKNPVFHHLFGDDGFIISLLAVILGLGIIWFCDRVYEHYLLKREEELDTRIRSTDEQLEELLHQVAILNTEQLLEKETREILEDRLDELRDEHENNRSLVERSFNRTVERFLKDLNE